MKRLFSLLLTLCLLLSLLSVGAAAAETRDPLADGYYLMGTHNSWNADNLSEALRFHESLGDPDEFILETTLTQGQEFKVVKLENGAVTAWYPDGANNNYVVDANHAGPAILYFRDSYWNDWAANGGYVWVGGKPAVEYMDENGATQSCTAYTSANYAGAAWSGWIVLTEDLTVTARVQVTGDVSLILEDGKTLSTLTGIHIPEGSSLTIYAQEEGTGAIIANLDIQLDFTDPDFDESLFDLWMEANGKAAIGGDNNEDAAGVLTINGGAITAFGGDLAAGIGCGMFGGFESITINGGAVTAYGTGDCGDGIGAGDSSNSCPDVTINGGYVTAYAGGSGAGIGCHHNAELVINGGEVNAFGGTSDGGVGGAGIGGDFVNMDAGVITINGGVVNAYGGDGENEEKGGAGIGGASGGCGGVVTINGGVVNAVGGEMGGAGIGPGAKTAYFPMDPGEVSTVTINGGQVTASSENGVGIGFYGTQNYTTDPVVALVTLGWTEESDFIQATSYAGTVTLADDWAVEDSEETFSAGPVEDNASLADKKLIPFVFVPADPIENRDLRLYSSISVGTDMVVTWTARKTDVQAYEKFWIEVVKHAPEGDVVYAYGAEQPEALDENSTTWSADFKHIFAKEMGVEIEARLYVQDELGQIYMSPVKTSCIRDYLAGRLIATTNTVEQRVLAADMLNYGAAAQKYMDYETEHLVNAELTATALAKLHEYETKTLPAVNKTNSNYRPEGASNILFNSVSLDNEVILTLTVRANQGDTVKVLMKDHDSGVVLETLDAAWNGSNFTVDYRGIGADKMRVAYDFTAVVNEAETGNTRTWSVEGYVGEIRAGNLPLKTAMANALLVYGDSAAAYFAAQ